MYDVIYLKEVNVHPSALKKITISGFITAVGLAFGLLMSQSPVPAQQQKGKGGPPAPVPPLLQNYSPVTAERLKNPADGEWLMIRRTYNGWGYSPLNQINATNVSKLRLVWSTITGESRVHEAAPLVNNGAMFVSTPTGQVIAFDAKTGDVLWRYRKPRPEGAVILHDVNRGVALYGDKVYYAAGEAELVALDAKTGRPVWTTTVADNKAAYYITLAPLIAGGKVMVGGQGALAHLHDSRPGRAGQRDVAEGWRSMDARRRFGVGHGKLRSRHKHRLLGHGKRRTMDG